MTSEEILLKHSEFKPQHCIVISVVEAQIKTDISKGIELGTLLVMYKFLETQINKSFLNLVENKYEVKKSSSLHLMNEIQTPFGDVWVP